MTILAVVLGVIGWTGFGFSLGWTLCKKGHKL